MKTTEELRKLETPKLNEELQKAMKTLFETKFHVKSGQARNVADVRKNKDYVARIKTIIKEKENNLEKVA